MPTSPAEMRTAIARNLEARTGRTLEAWVALAREQGLPSVGQTRTWLMDNHGLGHGTASLIAQTVHEVAGGETPEALLAGQYAGPKAALRPICDRLLEAAAALGPDVRAEPRRTYVSLSSRRQFAIIAASTRTRVDLGLRLDAAEVRAAPTRGTTLGAGGGGTPERLREAGSFGSGNVTHRVGLSGTADVDAEVLAWLAAAHAAAR